MGILKIESIGDGIITIELTPEEVAERARWERERIALFERIERERLERLEAEHAYRAAWHAEGRAKIVCSICWRGPFDGLELYRRGELFCNAHMPPAIESAAAPVKKTKAPSSPNTRGRRAAETKRAAAQGPDPAQITIEEALA
jgi:hypothetical protein